jgi:fructokinase
MSSRPVIVGIGEVLWDVLPAGRQLGGAPANFACQARALGAEARLVSRVGNDALGREALAALAALGLPTDSIGVDSSLPTSTVSVTVDAGGQPRYQIHENVAWDALRVDAAAQFAVAGAGAVCFGTLAQRSELSRATIRALVQAAPAEALRIFDVNLRQHYFTGPLIEQSLAQANILKVNDAELPRLSELFHFSGDVRSQVSALAGKFKLRLVACTRGQHGSLLFSEGQWSEHTGRPTEVVDTVGAGDAFTAAMAVGLLAGWTLDEINERANAVAAYVCSQPGATPALPDRVRSLFVSSP